MSFRRQSFCTSEKAVNFSTKANIGFTIDTFSNESQFLITAVSSSGDNVIDNEEFEYVLSEFGVSERTARQAFTIFTEVSRNGSEWLRESLPSFTQPIIVKFEHQSTL